MTATAPKPAVNGCQGVQHHEVRDYIDSDETVAVGAAWSSALLTPLTCLPRGCACKHTCIHATGKNGACCVKTSGNRLREAQSRHRSNRLNQTLDKPHMHSVLVSPVGIMPSAVLAVLLTSGLLLLPPRHFTMERLSSTPRANNSSTFRHHSLARCDPPPHTHTIPRTHSPVVLVLCSALRVPVKGEGRGGYLHCESPLSSAQRST